MNTIDNKINIDLVVSETKNTLNSPSKKRYLTIFIILILISLLKTILTFGFHGLPYIFKNNYLIGYCFGIFVVTFLMGYPAYFIAGRVFKGKRNFNSGLASTVLLITCIFNLMSSKNNEITSILVHDAILSGCNESIKKNYNKITSSQYINDAESYCNMFAKTVSNNYKECLNSTKSMESCDKQMDSYISTLLQIDEKDLENYLAKKMNH